MSDERAREDRYAKAIWGNANTYATARAVMAVADAEIAARVEAAVSVARAERDEALGSLHHAEVRCNALREAGNDWMARAEAAEAKLAALQAPRATEGEAWASTCFGCGWSTTDTRYDTHICPAAEDAWCDCGHLREHHEAETGTCERRDTGAGWEKCDCACFSAAQ